MAQPQTLAQKLIAAACGRETVSEGEIVTCAVDLAMFHDSSGPRRLKPMLEELGATLWDPSRIVLVIDHYVPESDDESRRIVRIARDWAAEQQLPNVYDSVGICHVVVPQHGHIRPGMFCVGGDSHSPTGGAFGAYMFGIGSTEMLGVAVTGQIWVKVPKTLMMNWRGRLADGVTAKDMMLHMIGRYGMNGGRYQAVEFCGEAVRALSMQERMTLSNMSAELGSQVGLIAPDETTAAWLRDAGVTQALDLARWQSDPGADAEWHEFDAAALAPQVAAPHSPANSRGVDTYNDVPVQVAYIGACTGAKLDDLRAAATVLRGRRLADGMQLMVAPASRQDQDQADREGVMQVLRDAGAQVLATSCGACAGYGGSIPDGASVIATTARNFKGRMGSETAQVYLASPYTVAASAVAGRIADPREFLA
ncbi:3-isopropylmalate dehydratase large subunit [Achromobacter sp. Root565]|uniref:3-isopropylmalate dehydratase large subunit n=1 Tax=Achromobacter sp. Root565 TaxID=1736564 RepID=UPI0006F2A785|nr:3-isopropylmalate dehydratase large subunit [Achromobacter sp. Root565]KQZ98152.1 3-isopropylmalate dehydratase [Achromobacter sp. Root565]